jgi:hypothetical protein
LNRSHEARPAAGPLFKPTACAPPLTSYISESDFEAVLQCKDYNAAEEPGGLNSSTAVMRDVIPDFVMVELDVKTT